jgi:hypothetical protein
MERENLQHCFPFKSKGDFYAKRGFCQDLLTQENLRTQESLSNDKLVFRKALEKKVESYVGL